ncbi:hypothetical protein ACWCPD_25630 [Streptomyces sp. NPDC001935]
MIVYYIASTVDSPAPQKYQYQAPNGVCVYAVAGTCSAPASAQPESSEIPDLPCLDGDPLCGIRNAYYKTMVAFGPSIGLVGAKAWDEALTTKVYRFEGANERVRVINGYPVIRNSKKMLFLNFGNKKRMEKYLEGRKSDPRYANSTVKSFPSGRLICSVAA